MLLPSVDAVCYAFVKAGRTHDRLDAGEPKPISYLVAHAGEGNGDALALQLLDGVQQRVAGTGVDEVDRVCIEKNVLCRRAVGRHRSLQPGVEVADTRKEEFAADAPNQQTREGDRLRVAPDVSVGLLARQLAEHRACGWLVR